MRAALIHTPAAPHWAWGPCLYCTQYIISLIEGQRNQSQKKKNGKESLEHKVCEIEITQEKTKQNTDKPTGVKALTRAQTNYHSPHPASVR